MTEFYNLGKHCEDPFCRQQDFLPFHCNHCSAVFCKDHHDTHRCEAREEAERVSIVPTCPVCNHLVPKRFPQESNDLVIYRHLESGECGKGSHTVIPTRSKDDYCHLKNCHSVHNTAVFIKCNGCDQKFCLDHRLAEDHSCKCLKQNIPLSAKLQKEKAASDMKKLMHNTLGKKTKVSLKRRDQTSAITFSNTPQTAVIPTKRPNLDREDQVHLPVFFPLDKYQPMYMYFPAMSSVGKCIDMICEYAKMNFEKQGLNLRMYNLVTKKSLPVHMALRDLLREKQISEGNAVMFEYGSTDTLSETVITEMDKYASLKSKTKGLLDKNCGSTHSNSLRRTNPRLIYAH